MYIYIYNMISYDILYFALRQSGAVSNALLDDLFMDVFTHSYGICLSCSGLRMCLIGQVSVRMMEAQPRKPG